MKKGKYIDRGKDIVYNDDIDIRSERAILLDEIITKQGLIIQVWDVDFQHALEGHPEVTIERIRESLRNPEKVVQSKRSSRVCLFYSLEDEDHPEFGTIYFCVVVGVIGNGKGKMETAYETVYIKKGSIIFTKTDADKGKR